MQIHKITQEDIDRSREYRKKEILKMARKDQTEETFLLAIGWAAESNFLDTVQQLLEEKEHYMPNFDIKEQYKLAGGTQSILSVACRYGAIDIVRWLVKEKDVDVNTVVSKRNGSYPIHIAAQSLCPTFKVTNLNLDNVVLCAKLLIDNGALNHSDANGKTFRDIMNYYMGHTDFLASYGIGHCVEVMNYYESKHDLPLTPSPSILSKMCIIS